MRVRAAADVVGPRKPITGRLVTCCALATSGHAAAMPLKSVINSRRFIFALTRSRGREASGQGKSKRLGGLEV